MPVSPTLKYNLRDVTTTCLRLIEELSMHGNSCEIFSSLSFFEGGGKRSARIACCDSDFAENSRDAREQTGSP